MTHAHKCRLELSTAAAAGTIYFRTTVKMYCGRAVLYNSGASTNGGDGGGGEGVEFRNISNIVDDYCACAVETLLPHN